jgi:orotidine-5'-phosphate decarboxylase
MQQFSERRAAAIRARRSVVSVELDPALGRIALVIIDMRRGDIASTGAAYGRACGAAYGRACGAAGFVVTASRSIIYARQAETADCRRAAAAAAESMRDDFDFAL